MAQLQNLFVFTMIYHVIDSRLKYAELTIISMYEELQVIRATQVAEEDLKNLSNELCNAVADVDQQVMPDRPNCGQI